MKKNGVVIDKFAVFNEVHGWRDLGTELDGIGTFCHEFSHCLGLPDFYSTVNVPYYGMGSWSLMDEGCKLVIFIEFVPVTEEARHLSPGDAERAYMAKALDDLRQHYDESVLLSFPGDELSLGGCMAAGREFFHINSHGGAEPCPFSPYSDVNIKETSLKEAIRSPLFLALQDEGVLGGPHVGGCVLYEKREEVERLMEEERRKKAQTA